MEYTRDIGKCLNNGKGEIKWELATIINYSYIIYFYPLLWDWVTRTPHAPTPGSKMKVITVYK